MNVKDNKTKNESSRIFSTTENTSSLEDKIINGLVDVIERQTREYMQTFKAGGMMTYDHIRYVSRMQ